MTFMQWLLFAMLVGFLSVSAANTVEGLSFPDQETRERYNGLIDAKALLRVDDKK